MIDEKKLIEELKESNYHHASNTREKALLDRVIKIVEEQPKLENTDCFKHFKLHADSTLKSMTKDELIDYIHMLYRNWSIADERYNNVMNYAMKQEKALDKACEELQRTYPCGVNRYETDCNKESWKEWCLKDVE